jgi:hypothetical protein
MARYWGQNILIYGDYVQISDKGITAQNPKKDEWERKTQDVFRTLEGTRVGGVLIRLINNVRRSLTVRPVASSLIGETRAAANAPVHAGERGQQVKPGEPQLADGLGSGATLWFDPDAWSGTAKSTVDPASHMAPDDVLFHECVHAYRFMRGKAIGKKMEFFENREEFYAVLLTNIYVADRNRLQDLRGSHRLPFDVLGFQQQFAAPQRSDKLFYFQFTTEIDELCTAMPELTTPLSGLPTWNPLRARRDKDKPDPMFTEPIGAAGRAAEIIGGR